MLATGAGALAGSALGTAAGHAAADTWNEHHAEEASQAEVQQTEEEVQQTEEEVQQPEEDVQQPEEEVTVISTEDITTDDILIEPEDEPIAPVYGGPGMVEPEDIEPIDIVVDMYGGPAMYDPEPLLDIETPNITDDILLSDVSDDLPDNIDTGNFDVCNDTYLV